MIQDFHLHEGKQEQLPFLVMVQRGKFFSAKEFNRE